MREKIIAITTSLGLLLVALFLIVSSLTNDETNSFDLIINGRSANTTYWFSKVDNETLVVYFGGNSLAEYFDSNAPFMAIRREERVLTSQESMGLMRLVRTIEENSPNFDDVFVSGGVWIARLRYNDEYYSTPFFSNLSAVTEEGVVLVELVNKLSELSPFPIYIRNSPWGS